MFNKIKEIIRKNYINAKINQCAKHKVASHEMGFINVKDISKKFDNIKDIYNKC